LTVATPEIPFVHPESKSTVDVPFEINNPGPQTVRVVGMRIGCAALLPTEDLPSEILPGQRKRFDLKLQAFSEAGARQTGTPLYVYTTAFGQAEVEFTLVGR
jgi:hypothetical protein